MDVKIDGGRISFCLLALLEKFPTEEKRALAEVLSCEDDIFDHVAAQIIDGWTENSHHGGVSCVAEANPRSGLDRAWRNVALASGGIARREIERLETALANSEDRRREVQSKLDEIWHKA